MTDTFQNTGDAGGVVDRGSDVQPGGGADNRADRMEQRHADSVSPGHQERDTDRQAARYPDQAPSGHDIKTHLRAAFADANRRDDLKATPEGARELLPEKPGGATRDPATGRFTSNKVTEPGVEPPPSPPSPAAPGAPVPQPPGGWDQAAKSRWNTLHPDVQAAIAKRETEVSDGFKSKSETEKQLNGRVKAYDDVVAKHSHLHDWMKQTNTTPAGLFDQLLNVMNAVTQQDKAGRIGVIAGLMRNAGLTAQDLVNAPRPDPAQAQVQQLRQEVAQMRQQNEQIQQERANAEKAALTDHVTKWAVDKPSYNDRADVRDWMGRLLNGPNAEQEYRLANGYPNLDLAFQRACAAVGADPRSGAQMVREHRNEHAQQARLAGVSVGSRAPTQPILANNQKGPKSVRDRLYQSLDELRR
jgi:hypothetical protein